MRSMIPPPPKRLKMMLSGFEKNTPASSLSAVRTCRKFVRGARATT
ncbi:hypothetical protein SAMN05216483_6251 [Streptomyces sp. 2131.1]|nr:hypothetical protein SAMN05216483_6251 [Streptomyces sp. 2131.1]